MSIFFSGQRDGSALKNTGCSSRAELNSSSHIIVHSICNGIYALSVQWCMKTESLNKLLKKQIFF